MLLKPPDVLAKLCIRFNHSDTEGEGNMSKSFLHLGNLAVAILAVNMLTRCQIPPISPETAPPPNDVGQPPQQNDPCVIYLPFSVFGGAEGVKQWINLMNFLDADIAIFPAGEVPDSIRQLPEGTVAITPFETEGVFWEAVEFPHGTEIDPIDTGDGQGIIKITIPGCGNKYQFSPQDVGKIPSQPCRIPMSKLPPGTTQQPKGHYTQVTFPSGSTPEDWFNPPVDWWFPQPQSNSVNLPAGTTLDDSFKFGTFVNAPVCFPPKAEVFSPTLQGDTLNTGTLPEGASLSYGSGKVKLDLPSGADLAPWEGFQPRVSLNPGEAGGTLVLFPLGTEVTPLENGTYDLKLGPGEAASPAAYQGWAWQDDCALLITPVDGLKMNSSSSGALSLDLPPGPAADAWKAEAEKDGRVTVSENGEGGWHFEFPSGSTLTPNADGTFTIAFPNCP